MSSCPVLWKLVEKIENLYILAIKQFSTLRGYLTTEEIIINLKNLVFGEHGIYYLSDNLFFHKSFSFIAIVNLFTFVKTGITLDI